MQFRIRSSGAGARIAALTCLALASAVAEARADVTYSSGASASAFSRAVRFGAGVSPPGATTATGTQSFSRFDAGPVPTQVATSDTTYTFPFAGPTATGTAQAMAMADLASGLLRARASGNCDGPFAFGAGTACNVSGEANAQAVITDLLTFTPTRADGLAEVFLNIDGRVTEQFAGNALVSAYLVLTPVVSGSFGTPLIVNFNSGTGTVVSGGWINPNAGVSDSGGDIAFGFSALLPLAQYTTYAMRMQLDVQAQRGSSVDFSHTATTRFGVSGVEVTSQSGVFNAVTPIGGGVPEPQAWVLMLAGFFWAGSALRGSRALGPRRG